MTAFTLLTRLFGLGDKATSIAIKVAALTIVEQEALAVPSDAAARDQQLAVEIGAVAEG